MICDSFLINHYTCSNVKSIIEAVEQSVKKYENDQIHLKENLINILKNDEYGPDVMIMLFTNTETYIVSKFVFDIENIIVMLI